MKNKLRCKGGTTGVKFGPFDKIYEKNINGYKS